MQNCTVTRNRTQLSWVWYFKTSYEKRSPKILKARRHYCGAQQDKVHIPRECVHDHDGSRVGAGQKSTADKKRTPISLVFEPRASI